jgi:hypothetical protein
MNTLLRWVFLSVLIVGLSACAPADCEICEECELCEECPISPFPEGLKLPQIAIQGRLYWTVGDLESLQTNVIDPIVAYFESEEQQVVSISVTTEDLSAASIETILVDVIVSNLDHDVDPIIMGVLIEKVDGVFPLWEPESMGP